MEFREPFNFYFVVWLPLFLAGLVMTVLTIAWSAVEIAPEIFFVFISYMMPVTVVSAGLAVALVELVRAVRRLAG